MSRRFTDTEKWDDPWFWKRSKNSKIVFSFLCDKVDQGGFFKWDSEIVAMKTRLKLSEVKTSIDALTESKDVDGKLKVIRRGGFIYLRSFTKVQDPNGLSVSNPAHIGPIKRLIAMVELFPECAVYFPDKVPKMRKNVETLLKATTTRSRENSLKNLLAIIEKAEEKSKPFKSNPPPEQKELFEDKTTPMMIKTCLRSLSQVRNYPYNPDLDKVLLIELMKDFPGVNLVTEIKKKITWWMDNPLTRRSSPRLQIRNWIENCPRFAEEKEQKIKDARQEQRDLVKKRKKKAEKKKDIQDKKAKTEIENTVEVEKWLDNHIKIKDIDEVMKKMETDRGTAIYFINLRRRKRKMKLLKGGADPLHMAWGRS